MHPGALLEAGVKKVGIIRVDLPKPPSSPASSATSTRTTA